MSHIAEIDLHITDLEALRAACRALHLEFRENQRTYRWYGHYMGDGILPEGFTPQDLGKCEHAIGAPGNPRAYEIGVLKRRGGKPGYCLHYDPFNGGFGLEALAGRNASRLIQEYGTQVAMRHLQSQGFRVQRTVTPDGTVRLRYQKERTRVTVEMDPQGRAKVAVEGCPGPACQALTRDLEAALGETVSDRPTREMSQQAHVPLRQVIKR